VLWRDVFVHCLLPAKLSMPQRASSPGVLIYEIIHGRLRKRMRSGDRPGLQNRRAAGHPVTGGFDPHSLPPFFNDLKTCKSLANQFGFGRAICTTLEWASCISFVTRSAYTLIVVRMSPWRNSFCCTATALVSGNQNLANAAVQDTQNIPVLKQWSALYAVVSLLAPYEQQRPYLRP